MNNHRLIKLIKIIFCLNVIIFSSLCIAEDKVLKEEETLLKLQKEINQLDKIDNPCIYVGVFLLFIFTQKIYNNRYLRQHSD